MEDYKKKYENALNAARKFKNDCPLFWNTKNNPFKCVFEELEDEDEKIRKELLKIVKESEDSFYMVMTPRKRESLISWLEKQGEQKSEEVDNLHNYLYDEQNPADEVGNYDHKKVLQTIINEQKPAWSKEDEWKFSDILSLLRGGENCHYNTPELFDWLKSIKERMK